MKLILSFIAMLVFTFASDVQSFSAKDSLQIHSIFEDWNKAWDVKIMSLLQSGIVMMLALPMLLEISAPGKMRSRHF